MSQGLTRRRTGASPAVGASSSGQVESPTFPSGSTIPRPGSSVDSAASGAYEGRAKIAYDPRDFENGNEKETVPRLTLMEEVLLLGLKDKAGYLSFWNDNISYALRGCILIELALRGRIAMVRDPARRRLALSDRLIEVIDDRQTGETILDEALKMIKSSEKYGAGAWVDLMSGETWNVMKIGYQLKQVRERLAKGLVDKGVLRTEKRNFLLFDMATHPIADMNAKDDVMRRVLSLLTARTAAIPPQALHKEGVKYRHMRAVVLVCAAYASSVLENALQRLSYDSREAAFARCDDILAEFCIWPFGQTTASSSGPVAIGSASARRREGGSGGAGKESVQELVREVRKEMASTTSGAGAGGGQEDQEELCFEVIATVLEIFGRMDSLL
ncbi:golgi phosphoprotein 3 [Cryptococcus neoformans C23]|uniref:Vacuolar protein sorting-associated protein 74 n=2 Tax=Cryptococcus neoformans TaxID=5207 RepID=A0A854Q6W3_CRYNE|nr:golgi phosphoprotein 3 [Cryptococcus neoformans var. grubii H99]AUB27430.1 golgi phosphoprotein 3 [Cryptococcus neoformans var. grubii]OWZ28384.1 golgi phosphoprotein 3 [Cryptococcus neoformans var. grubii AD2-60a]OWZ34117.1 golgi phosphoprotein 3 [Cryptococcus neoformans var. grubii AD1-83a]OWZ40331.1 golgi phosphoprotein 3 [Cryptococcus neoformans var. grubii C23]OWZ51232.1 golgi phosphoprotein 3 [Cryptococcus neoformans var. grubii 125.91]OXC82404.1 golgi phosphoprotein 3 [Cryptococcus |eukprot:XP_012051952.1 golgi phosphoprotein 3 [Cryptococcus neoformans var. grubii H99]